MSLHDLPPEVLSNIIVSSPRPWSLCSKDLRLLALPYLFQTIRFAKIDDTSAKRLLSILQTARQTHKVNFNDCCDVGPLVKRANPKYTLIQYVQRLFRRHVLRRSQVSIDQLHRIAVECFMEASHVMIDGNRSFSALAKLGPPDTLREKELCIDRLQDMIGFYRYLDLKMKEWIKFMSLWDRPNFMRLMVALQPELRKKESQYIAVVLWGRKSQLEFTLQIIDTCTALFEMTVLQIVRLFRDVNTVVIRNTTHFQVYLQALSTRNRLEKFSLDHCNIIQMISYNNVDLDFNSLWYYLSHLTELDVVICNINGFNTANLLMEVLFSTPPPVLRRISCQFLCPAPLCFPSTFTLPVARQFKLITRHDEGSDDLNLLPVDFQCPHLQEFTGSYGLVNVISNTVMHQLKLLAIDEQISLETICDLLLECRNLTSINVQLRRDACHLDAAKLEQFAASLPPTLRTLACAVNLIDRRRYGAPHQWLYSANLPDVERLILFGYHKKNIGEDYFGYYASVERLKDQFRSEYMMLVAMLPRLWYFESEKVEAKRRDGKIEVEVSGV